MYSKKCLKQRCQSRHPSLQQSRRYFRAEKVTRLRLLFEIEYLYPADSVTKRFVYFHLKGQMNQKIDIFSFGALSSPNTKKNHPKLDLGEDISYQAECKRQECFPLPS